MPTIKPPADENGEEADELIPPPERKGRIWVILIMLLLLIILGGAYFFIFKKPGGMKKSKPGTFNFPLPPKREPLLGPQLQVQQPTQTFRKKPEKSKVEDELERSLREARRLLGK